MNTTINFELYKKPHTADVRVLKVVFINGDGEQVTDYRCIISTIDNEPLHEIERRTDDIVQYCALSQAVRAKAISAYKQGVL